MVDKEKIDSLLSDIEALKALITDSGEEDSGEGGETLGKAFDVAQSVLKQLHDLAEAQIATLRKEVEAYRKTLSEPEEIAPAPPVPHATEKKNLPDFTKAFSVNDRFYFLKELFGGDMAKMKKVLATLNAMHTFEEADRFLHETMRWDKENATVMEFLKLLKKRFR
jgi:hypothetical protein